MVFRKLPHMLLFERRSLSALVVASAPPLLEEGLRSDESLEPDK